jgi:hypothetical protein
MSIKQSELIKLNDVQIAFPHLFEKKSWEGKTPQYQCLFLLDKNKHTNEINMIKEKIDYLIKENQFNKETIRICLQDGDNSGREEYKGHYTICAKNMDKFPIVDKDGKTPILPHNDPFYGGCYTSAYITLFPYKHKTGGRGISSNLKSIQFRKDGERLGHKPQNIEGAFDPIEDDSVSDFF